MAILAALLLHLIVCAMLVLLGATVAAVGCRQRQALDTLELQLK
jgi:uncharacterized BrkB/YihY/UPF0761 family membrane protein